jgi:tRNA-modifying protein YgfZ
VTIPSGSLDRWVPPTVLRLEGRDVMSLLHRVTTQHLADLASGACRATLFCDYRGRVQHRVIVARTSDDAVWLLRDDAPPDDLVAAIRGQIFRDDVRVIDRTGAFIVNPHYRHIRLAPGALDEVDGVPWTAYPPGGPELTLHDPLESVLPQRRDTERIRAGLPRHGREIHADFTPFEIGRAADVHLDKGCFTGQEALLRMMTYHGVRRRLVLLEADDPAPAERATIRAANADVGTVTSVAAAKGRWVALAVVRRDAIDAGAPLEVAGLAVAPEVTPFPDTRPLGLPEPTAP